MAASTILVLMLMVMLMRVFLPQGMQIAGRKTFEMKLSFAERLIYQRLNLYCIGVVLVLMTLTGTIANGIQLGVIVTTQAILMIPVKVRVTTNGIAINRAVYRNWSDFSGFSTAGRRLVLHGQDGARSMTIPILAENQKVLATVLGRHLARVGSGKEARSKHPITVN